MELYYSKSLGDKNFSTINDVLKTDRKMIQELQEENLKLKQQMAMMQQEIIGMMNRVNIMFAKTNGTGATQ